MTDRIVEVLTEAFKDAECECNWTPEGHAIHALAALKAARIAVVELPEPTVDNPEFDLVRWDQCCNVELDKRAVREPERWTDRSVKHSMGRFGTVFGYTPNEAGLVAVALLAAKAAAEVSQ